jgi:transcriptional regulator with XRE-family HTH domain
MKDEFKAHYETVGINVRNFRKELGWSQEELAKRCSVNAAKISRIENARSDYMHSTLLEVCGALKKSLAEIIKS